ncbi:MAG TPA: response regulator [Saprospiraceae bacterium]|nr:response regulator [Saprospiraceae bacterium]
MSSSTPVSVLDPKTILLAHGDDATRYLLKQILKNAGYRRTVAVKSGREATNRLVQGGIDLVITGTELKDTDGWRLIRMVRSGNFCLAGLPVLIVCNPSQPGTLLLLAQEHGAHLLLLDEMAYLPERVALYLENQTKTKPNVLVIEDDEEAAKLAELSLQTFCTVEAAYDGTTGLAAWQARKHDLVLLDVMLPKLPGPQVLHQIISAKPTQAVIMITAYGTRLHQDLVLAGAIDFLIKPVDPADLRRQCEGALRSHAYLRQYDQLQREEKIRDEINHKLLAAHHLLKTGRAGLAARHLQRALALNGEKPLSDDDWERLLNEFE